MKKLLFALTVSLLGTSACKNSSTGETKSASEAPAAASAVALKTVRAYYAAFQAENAAAVKEGLLAIFDENVTLDSPLVVEKFKKPAVGAQQTLAFAMAAADLLRHATVRDYYVSISDPTSIATIIDEPNPCGNTPQSEYFKIDLTTGKIKSIYSNYDPRLLMSFLSGAGCPKAAASTSEPQ